MEQKKIEIDTSQIKFQPTWNAFLPHYSDIVKWHTKNMDEEKNTIAEKKRNSSER